MLKPFNLVPARGICNVVTVPTGAGDMRRIGYALFADCDDCDREEAEERIKSARMHLSFGDVFLIRSSANCYHAVVPECRTLEEALTFCVWMKSGHLLDNLRTYDLCVLRTSEKKGFKPRFEGVSRGLVRAYGALSFAHLQYLKEMGADLSSYGEKELLECIDSVPRIKEYYTGEVVRVPEVDGDGGI